MMGYPVSDEEANQFLKLWGLANRIGGPKGYPKVAAFMPKARGKDLEWTVYEIELVGSVVQQLDPDQRAVVKLYYEPDDSGKGLNVTQIEQKTGIKRKKVHEALDRCIGRVAQALSYPVLDFTEKKVCTI